MVEYASMRFRFACAMAMMLPAPMDSTDRITSIAVQSPCMPGRPSTSRRMSIPKAAILGALPMNSVTDVGAPSYTSGTHM